MIQAPATRDAPAFEALYALVRDNLDAGAGDIPVDRLMQIFRRLSDLYDTDVSSPLNMGYFCIDADAASIAAMDEDQPPRCQRRGAGPASGLRCLRAIRRRSSPGGLRHRSRDRCRSLHRLRHRGKPHRHDRRSDRPAFASQPAMSRLRPSVLHGQSGARRAVRVLAPRMPAAERAACALCLAPDPRLDREERAQPDRYRVDPHRAGGQRPSHGRGRA